jgi:endonuclease/exonuclease/phosphatase family metal-dependent hydrolase
MDCRVTTDQVTDSLSGRPSFRVDYVLVRPAERWRVIDARVLDVPVVFDHRPVLVVLELTDE